MFAARLGPLLAMSWYDSPSAPSPSPTSPTPRLRARTTLQRLSHASLTAIFFTVLAKLGYLVFMGETILAEFFHAVFLLGLAAQIVLAWCGLGYALYRRQTPMRRWIIQLAVLLSWDQIAGPAVLVSARRMQRQLAAHTSGMADAKLGWEQQPGENGWTETDDYWAPELGNDAKHLGGQPLLHLKPGTFLFIISFVALVGYGGYRMAERVYANPRDDSDSFSEAGSVEEQVEKMRLD
ncbi:uncharacterized protein LOC62_02G003438 [Vanrija pseudolonga]|uniref:Uncharacterized protein n=1 Tax=Vanrija pseudolonga TaxID=143232 RepID=A0AAF0Y880_9TREE|nr:hypothetical protein LOC62_02G003438 [Vanrija pseudolonga]